jgi:hypothetical protein
MCADVLGVVVDMMQSWYLSWCFETSPFILFLLWIETTGPRCSDSAMFVPAFVGLWVVVG